MALGPAAALSEPDWSDPVSDEPPLVGAAVDGLTVVVAEGWPLVKGTLSPLRVADGKPTAPEEAFSAGPVLFWGLRTL